ncbi:MAG TPA: hypothetical protein VI300_24845 [Solirubrobacter sp.]
MPRPRSYLAALAFLVVAVVSSGCVAIKQQVAIQSRLPGFVTLRVDVCVSDHDQSTYGSCDPDGRTGLSGTAESDNGRDGDESAGRGQLLVGYRVPNGSSGPSSFVSGDGQLTLSRNADYTAALTANLAAAAGFHWEGYLSSETVFDPNVAGDRTTTLSPEFTLPSEPSGAPFTGPYRWRPVVGFRATGGGGVPVDPASKVNCQLLATQVCFDSPTSVTADLVKNVSDVGVLRGSDATVSPGETAVVDFSAVNRDAGGLGARTLLLGATSTVPNASVTTAGTLPVGPNATASTAVKVSVPAGTSPGTYTVTLTGTANAGVNGTPLSRSNTGTITVVAPPPPPAAAVESPARALPTAAPPSPAPAAAPPAHIAVTIAFDFPSAAKSTTFTRLQVKGIPSGATVDVSCQGKFCPKQKGKAVRLSKSGAPRVLSLRPWLKKPLRAGTVLTVTVTKPGSFGMVKTLTVKKNKRPTISTSCLRPDSKTKAACET